MAFSKTAAIRAERRKSAEERNARYNEKYPTPEAKLAALPPTGCARQRAKLTRQIAEAAEKAQAAKLAAAAKAEAKAEKSEKNNKKGKNQ